MAREVIIPSFPTRGHDNASQTNSFSLSAASQKVSLTRYSVLTQLLHQLSKNQETKPQIAPHLVRSSHSRKLVQVLTKIWHRSFQSKKFLRRKQSHLCLLCISPNYESTCQSLRLIGRTRNDLNCSKQSVLLVGDLFSKE